MSIDLGGSWLGGLVVVGACLLAGLFEYFHRVHGRRYLRLWALSWLAGGVHAALDVFPELFSVVGSGLCAFVQLFAGYLHVWFLLWGGYEARVGERSPNWANWGAFAIALLLAASSATTFSGVAPDRDPFNTPVFSFNLVTGVVYLVGGLLLFTWRGVRSVGSSVVSSGLVLHAVLQLTRLSPNGALGAVSENPLTQLFVEFLLALGLVIWLLEEASNQAVSTAAGLHRAQEVSLRRFRRLLEKGWDLVELRQPDGSVDWVSQSVERVLGVDLADYVATAPLESVHRDDRPAMRKLLSGRFPTQDPAPIRMLGGDGRYRQLESVSVDLTADPDVQAIVVTSRDVTDRNALQRELLDASGRERRELGRELHDGLGQLLTGIGFRVAQLEGVLQRGGGGTLELAAEIKTLVQSAVSQADSLARGLSPVSVQAAGIVSALESFADTLRDRYGAVCTVERVDVQIHDPEVASQIFMIAQEASLSAVKVHGSSALRLSVTRSGDGGVLQVKANRPRFPEAVREVRRATMTDRILHHRASVIDASLDIIDADEYGHTVICRFHRGAVEGTDLSQAG